MAGTVVAVIGSSDAYEFGLTNERVTELTSLSDDKSKDIEHVYSGFEFALYSNKDHTRIYAAGTNHGLLVLMLYFLL